MTAGEPRPQGRGSSPTIDDGFTPYCHGPEPRVSDILKTPGTVRRGQNIAAYLAGKDKLNEWARQDNDP